jgi:ubiquinone/menaquinone biosynthesis C-methylase UbiE
MILSAAQITALAPHFRKPEGEIGKEVGRQMAKHNEEAVAFTIKCLEVQPADHILEIGFGPGEGIAQSVQLTPNGYVAGIDISDVMLEMAKERNHRAMMQEHVELTLGEARSMPYEDESFHKLFAVNVFHFWKDPAIELAECFRVLRPGGKVAFFMSYPSSWRPGIKESGLFIAREPAQVEAELTKAGFVRPHSKSITLVRSEEEGEYRGFVTTGEKQ